MNEKLVQIYVEGLMKGFIKFTDTDMMFTPKAVEENTPEVHIYAHKVLELEYEAFPKKTLSTRATRKLPEFKAALQIYNSPLSEALK